MKSKYGNKKTQVQGINFDSKLEASYYVKLKLMETNGYISDLKLQVPYILAEKGKGKREMKYIADFVYFDNSTKEIVVADAKGFVTNVYKLKKRWMEEKYNIIVKEMR